MKSPCDLVIDRLASGEPLGAADAAHADRCVDCARLVEVPALLAAAAVDAAPGPGFAARMHAGARQRVTARRRARVALAAAASAAVVAAGTFAVTRHRASRIDPGATRSLLDEERPAPVPVVERAAATSAEELSLHLLRVADVDVSLAGEAPWGEITDRISPYRVLLDELGARKGAPR
jgi:hypothetical protein